MVNSKTFSREAKAFLKQNYPIYPATGIASTILGTFAALVLIPDNPYPAGALFPSGLAMTIGLAFAPALAAFQNIKVLLRAEHILILSPIYWLLLDLLQSAYDLRGVDTEDIEGAFIAIGLFACGIWTASLFSLWKPPKMLIKSARRTITTKQTFLLILFLFFLGIFYYAYSANFDFPRMFYALGENRWSAPWARGRLGGWNAFVFHMRYFGYLVPVLTASLWVKSNDKKNSKIIISILLSIVMLAFLGQGGGRRIVGGILTATLINWFVQQNKIDFRRVLVSIVSIVLIASLLQLILIYRNVGYSAIFSNQVEVTSPDHVHVDDNFLRLSQAIDIVPSQHSYVYEKFVFWALVRPIPRVFWPGKPTDPGFSLADTLGAGNVSYTMTVIGNFYISFGWLAIIVGGWFYGKLAGMTSTLLALDPPERKRSANSLVYSLSVMALFVGMRSLIDLVLSSYTLLAWLLISSFLSKQNTRKLQDR